MSLSLNFGNDSHFRLKWRFLLISLQYTFRKGFIVFFAHENPGIELIHMIVALIFY